MPISEQGYAHWAGTFIERRFPWGPSARLGIRLAFKRRFFKFVFAFTFLPAFVFLAGIYISERLEDFSFMVRGRQSANFLTINPAYFKNYFTADALLFFMLMLMVLAGAGLIADDLKFNALQLYFARPLRKRDYIAGKLATASFFLLSLSLVPGLLFIIFKIIFAGSFKLLGDFPWLPLSVVGYSLVLTLFFSLYTLLISSLSRNRRYTAILIFLVYILSDVFFGIFFEIFRSPYFSLLSIKCNLQQVGAAMFGVAPRYNVPWLYSLIVLAGIATAAGFILKRKVRSVEVIR
jgi:ABC-type transport system involved in multi-copper enzyme maturation permease subunit